MSGGDTLARRLVVGLAGPRLHAAEAAWIARWQPAGVILFGRNVTDAAQLTALCAELHGLGPDLEIVADHEGGPVSVLAAAVGRPPSAATLGLLDDPGLTRRVHAETAARLAACGIDRALAPVADVLTCRRNPVVGVRAFAAAADRAAAHVAAAVEGLLAGGVRTCLKHWPGHGGTSADSHLGAAPLHAAEPDLPFRAGLQAGADAVMVAHVLVPGSDRPASLDAAVAAAARALAPARTLRLYADDITMGALRGPLGAAAAGVPAGSGLVDPAALTAAWCGAVAAGGCDRLLVRGIPWGAWPGEPGLAPPTLDAAVAAAPGGGAGPAAGEALERLGSLLPADFADPARRLAWLDRTQGDRWGPLAAGEGAAGLPPALARAFGAVDDRVSGAERLLVTSHRPLDLGREAAWSGGLAASGVVLAVGHPALAGDLQALVPAGWRVSWLPEWPAFGRLQKI